MTKRIFTYFEPINQIGHSDELALIRLWKASWEAHGWETKVLNEYSASKHLMYLPYLEAIKKLPSINPVRYDQHCLLRWMAVAQALRTLGGIGVMSDYDVMCYGFEPLSVPEEKLCLYQRHVPALVSGSGWAFEKMVERFMNYQMRADDAYDGKPHISDMIIVLHSIEDAPADFQVEHLVRSYGETGWDTATAVHYCNAAMGPAGKTPRHQHIPSLRPI